MNGPYDLPRPGPGLVTGVSSSPGMVVEGLVGLVPSGGSGIVSMVGRGRGPGIVMVTTLELGIGMVIQVLSGGRVHVGNG